MTIEQLQTTKKHFTIAAFDQRGSLAKLMGVDPASEIGIEALTHFKQTWMEVVSSLCSAVLVDPEFGLDSLQKKDPKAGLLLSLERSSYDAGNKDALPLMYDGWGIPEIIARGGAVKLLLFYHPKSETATAKRVFVENIYNECKAKHVPFLLEPLLYSKDDPWGENMHKAQLQMVRDFTSLCDVLKLEFPMDPEQEFDVKRGEEYCKQVTHHATVPWIVLSRGMGYERFIRSVEVATQHGAQGFAVGRAVWKEVGEFSTVEEQDQFLHTTAKERMKQLIAIVE